jgi:hypothetical protein
MEEPYMDRLTTQDLNQLLRLRHDPSISIYLPVEKVGQDTRQGAIRLRKNIKAVAESLHERGLRTPVIEQLLKPAEALYDDALFWEHQNQGLALFMNQDGMIRHQLIERCEESVTIADRFMILPLLAEAAHDRIYYLLALSLDGTRLYRATRTTLTDCELPDPVSIKAVFDSYILEKQLQHHSSASGAGGTVFHGSDSPRDSEKQRIEEFFRQLDGNLKKQLAMTDAPLVVACVDYLFPIFSAVCKECRLVGEHISGSPENMKKDALLENGWQLARTVFDQNKVSALKTCGKLLGTERVRQGVGSLLMPAFQGRIDTLFLQRGSQVLGSWNPDTGDVIELTDSQPRFGDPDLLSAAAVMTLEQSGQVFILEEDEMPLAQECVAVLRF